MTVASRHAVVIIHGVGERVPLGLTRHPGGTTPR